MKNKKAQSQIVATVILILIVVVLAGLIVGFVVPFVQDKLDTGGCLEIVGEIAIKDSSQYTCYNFTANEMRMQIHVGNVENTTLKGIQIVIEKEGGASDSYEVSEGSTEVTMLGGDVELPEKNEERTYILSGISLKPNSVRIYPILADEETCALADSLIKVPSCL